MKPYRVFWTDAEDFKETWASKDEVDDFSKSICLVESIGFIIKKTDKYITLVRDIIKDEKGGDTYGGVTKIPRKMVKKIELI